MNTETARLHIRDFEHGDWQAVHAFLGDPQVTTYTSFHKASEEATRLWVEGCILHNQNQPRLAHNCAVVLKETGDLIGWIGIGLPYVGGIGDRTFGYALRSNAWNHGYMTEALVAVVHFCFSELSVGSVFGECRPANPASARVMEKAGLRYVGTFPAPSEGEGVFHQRFLAFREQWLAGHGTR